MIEVRGKRGVGYCKSTTGAVRPFERLTERNALSPTDLVFPSNHTKQFNSVLDELELKFDRDGNSRTHIAFGTHIYVCGYSRVQTFIRLRKIAG